MIFPPKLSTGFEKIIVQNNNILEIAQNLYNKLE